MRLETQSHRGHGEKSNTDSVISVISVPLCLCVLKILAIMTSTAEWSGLRIYWQQPKGNVRFRVIIGYAFGFETAFWRMFAKDMLKLKLSYDGRFCFTIQHRNSLRSSWIMRFGKLRLRFQGSFSRLALHARLQLWTSYKTDWKHRGTEDTEKRGA